MGNSWRRITYISFFALFLILTPIFIFLALGYRYNFDTHQIIKNGAFYVKSFPRGADIFISNDKYRSKTPTQVTGLAPNDYTLTVSKSGYVSWSKKLPVYSGQTTFAEDIVLWSQNRPLHDLSIGGENYIVSRDHSKYAFTDSDNNLHVTDVESDKDFNLLQLGDNYKFVDWSPNDQQLILAAKSIYYLFDINRRLLEPLPVTDAQKIIWDTNDNSLLWLLKAGQIYRLNIATMLDNESVPLDFADEINSLYFNDFDLHGDYLFTHYKISGVNIVEQLEIGSFKSITKITDLNNGKLDILYADDFKSVFTIGSKLYIKKIFAPLTEIPISQVKIHNQRLLFTNGHEIVEYNFDQDWQNLIDRSTQLVSDLAWHPNGSYFISEVNAKTTLYEFDGRDKRNSINILEDPHKKMYLFNKKGDKLFILTPDKNFYIILQ